MANNKRAGKKPPGSRLRVQGIPLPHDLKKRAAGVARTARALGARSITRAQILRLCIDVHLPKLEEMARDLARRHRTKAIAAAGDAACQ